MTTKKKEGASLESIEKILKAIQKDNKKIKEDLAELLAQDGIDLNVEFKYDPEQADEYGAVPLDFVEGWKQQLIEQGHADVARGIGDRFLWMNMSHLNANQQQQIRNNRNQWVIWAGQHSENQKTAELFEYQHTHNRRRRPVPGLWVATDINATVRDVAKGVSDSIARRLELKEADAGSLDFSPPLPR